ncbi:MAG: choice-of-anchor D domain-containing protein, partial [Terriglobia bacterium]
QFSSPFSIAAGDFNHDSNLDLAIADGEGVSVLLGNGNGTFQKAVTYTGTGFPISVAVADVDGDGNQDLAVVSSSSVAVLLGNGDGTFQPAITLTTGSTDLSTVAVGDVNGDGKPDLAVGGANFIGSPFTAFTSIFLGNGDGTFQAPMNYGVDESGLADHSLVMGDFRNDGSLDLAAAQRSATGVAILLNTPLAAFSPAGLLFPNQLLGAASLPQTLTLYNPSVHSLGISSVSVSGGFSQRNTCPVSPATLAPGASCAVSVRFKPPRRGTLTGAANFADNAPGATQTLNLTGTGTVVKVVPSSLSFGSVPVGMKTNPKPVNLTNTSATDLNVFGIGITGMNAGDFSQTNNCGSSLPPGASCLIQLTFQPSAKGERTASFSVGDNGGGSPQAVPLAGTGT